MTLMTTFSKKSERQKIEQTAMNPFFQIPEPCSEDWNEMTPTEKGAFCNKCSKEVLDLRGCSPAIAKNSILLNSNPCVRIGEGLLRELNFREWVQSLSLVRQLRWSFVIALFFSSISYGQPDSLKQDSNTFVISDYDATYGALIAPATSIDSITGPSCFPDNPNYLGGIDFGDVVEIQGGIPPPNINFESFTLDTNMTYTIPSTETTPKDPYEKSIQMNGNTYWFRQERQFIRFRVVSQELHVLKISAKADPSDPRHEHPDWKFHHPPLEIPKGQGEFSLPLELTYSGRYIIYLETADGKNSRKLFF